MVNLCPLETNLSQRIMSSTLPLIRPSWTIRSWSWWSRTTQSINIHLWLHSEVLMAACLQPGSAWNSHTLFRVLTLPALQFCFSQAPSLPTPSMSWSHASGISTILGFQPQFSKVSVCLVSIKVMPQSMQQSSRFLKLARISQRQARSKWLATLLTMPSVQCKWLIILTQLTSLVHFLQTQLIAPFTGCTETYQP